MYLNPVRCQIHNCKESGNSSRQVLRAISLLRRQKGLHGTGAQLDPADYGDLGDPRPGRHRPLLDAVSSSTRADSFLMHQASRIDGNPGWLAG